MVETKSDLLADSGDQPSKPAYTRILYFDLLNIAATICVVYLHCNGMVHTFARGWNWVLGLAIECVFYWAVPVFFMLSGATLIGYRKRYSTADYLKKRVSRIFVPFFAWSLIWYLLLPGIRGEEPSVVDFLTKAFGNHIWSVYWFFFPLFGIYLSMPLLSLLDGRYKLQLYLVVGTFILESVFPFVSSAFGVHVGDVVTISSASSYIIFVLLGYLLSQRDLTSKVRAVIYALGLFGLLFRFCYTLIFSEVMGELDRTFFSYIAFPSVSLSVAVFVWFKYHDWSFLERWSPRIAEMASCSFGIYLVHFAVLHVIVFSRIGVPVDSVLFRTVGALALYLMILVAVWMGKKIPGVRRLFP